MTYTSVVSGDDKLQPRRIGQLETAEWQELYEFYCRMHRQETQPARRLATIAAICLPVLMGVLNLVH